GPVARVHARRARREDDDARRVRHGDDPLRARVTRRVRRPSDARTSLRALAGRRRMSITIDYGIDLGTTNSAIARQDGTKTKLLTGRDGATLLPSAVFVDPGGALVVGAAAKTSASQRPADTATEFKRLMGTDESRAFPASGKRLRPEELSAEVLRELLRWAAA